MNTFFLLFSAKQMLQLEKHKALYNSINVYTQEIATSFPGLSPLTVLKTAIQLHQQEPRIEKHETEDLKSKALPLVQAPLPAHLLYNQRVIQPSHFEDKLEQLKSVLPSSSDVKLAALLTREKGDLNAVVQCILEEPAEAEDEATSKTLEMASAIDLTDEPASSFEKSIAIDLTEECDSSPRPTYITYECALSSVGQIDVKASTLADNCQGKRAGTSGVICRGKPLVFLPS